MLGTMNEYRLLRRPFRLAMPYRADQSDWRTAAIQLLGRAASRFVSFLQHTVAAKR